LVALGNVRTSWVVDAVAVRANTSQHTLVRRSRCHALRLRLCGFIIVLRAGT
jgi:hypothetical protein